MKPKSCILIFFLACIVLSVFSLTASATTQNLINVQGKAVNKTTGTLITVGNVSVRIYAAPDNGTAAHSETFTNVITNGTFSVQVGNSTTLNLTYNQVYWLEIDVNGEEVVGNATGAAGRRAFISTAGPDASILIVNDTSRNVGVNITNPGGIFQVSAGGTSTALFVNGTTGYVGIGLANPGQTLTVAGTGNFTSTLWAGSTITGINGLTISAGTISLPASSISQNTINGLTIPAANISAGTFASGLFTFQNNLTVAQNLTAGNTLWIDSALNRVGIGTTGPVAKLEIKESSTGAGNARTQLSGDGNNAKGTVLGALDFLNNDASGDGPNVAAKIEAQSFLATFGSGADLVFFTDDANNHGEGLAGIEKMRITGGGLVGIGTTLPVSEFEVNGTAPTISLQNGTLSGRINFDVNATGDLIVNSSSTNNILAVQKGGNVGIGTTSPQGLLHVRGSSPRLRVSGTAVSQSVILDLLQVDTASAETGWFIYSEGDTQDMIFRSVQAGAGTTRVVIDNSTGNVGINTTSPSGLLQVNVNGSDVFHINETGRVGIGTASPGAILHTETSTTDFEGLRILNSNAASGTITSSYLQLGITNSVAATYVRIAALEGSANDRPGISFSIADTSGGTPVEKMRIDNAGNVGIGTVAPVSNVDINASTPKFSLQNGTLNGRINFNLNATGDMTVNSSSTNNILIVNKNGNVGIGTTGPSALLDVNSSSADLLLNVRNTGTSYLAVNRTSGNVGIGTTGPGALLHVNSSGVSATGGTITNVGVYRIHTFTSNGTFTVTGSGNVEVLVVAGGGGGGRYYSGGGGAGGYVYNASFAVTAQAYSVTVGDGGAAGTINTGDYGRDGTNSVFGSITAIGGGGGNGSDSSGAAGRNGGSGGGAGGTGTASGGNATSGQGNAGGATSGSGGAGGGGAGEAGQTKTLGGKGGDGLASSISGSSVTYAGGGGGSMPTPGAGGAGGGGKGATDSVAADSGTANTGGGGGGGSNPQAAGAGGSGIVIIRYSTASAIFQNGNVGIGTVAPAATLHVNGSGSSSSGLRITNGTTEVMYVNTTSGNVGIGTAGPGAILDVQSANAQLMVTSTTGTNYVRGSWFNTGGQFYLGREQSAGGGILTGSSAYAGIVAVTGTYPLQFGVNNAVTMTMLSGGNVGIGTTAPKDLFEVKDASSEGLLFISGVTANVANTATGLFNFTLPGTDNAVAVTLQVHGISTGQAWFSFKQDFIAANNGAINTATGTAVTNAGGATMTLATDGTTVIVKFNHGSTTAASMSWSAVIQGDVGTITKFA